MHFLTAVTVWTIMLPSKKKSNKHVDVFKYVIIAIFLNKHLIYITKEKSIKKECDF